jgi:hypothetical protein
MSEVSHFFAARVTTASSLRASLERARIQAVVDSAGDDTTTPQTLLSPMPERRWVGFASPSDNREALWKSMERLVEVFEESGNWSASFFMERDRLTLRAEDLDPAREGFGISASQREWLRRFFGRAPEALLATLAVGGIFPFCQELGIPFLALMDQDMVPWERLAREFPERAVLDAEELSG